ncbi:probable inactive shikimate kinase like 2, chloroplastic [Solanum verrucosum]|uniref:probable inactive shikimate kinase like 2, chloroplastic n=1 Tax=Solanum verrucosum TaxID=315347 RepID=UPI0020D027B8|nr:probable inactive shikimate kinase like 2, chloroplastic [Solanum verrucosum]
MASSSSSSSSVALSFLYQNPIKASLSIPKTFSPYSKLTFPSIASFYSAIPRLDYSNFKKINPCLHCSNLPTASTNNTQYEFSDGSSEVELRLELGQGDVTPKDIYVDANESSLAIRVQQSGIVRTLMETSTLYEKIKPAETIWYIDEDQLVISLKKQNYELKWPDIVESWESLSAGITQLLRGTSIYLVGESTEINQRIARELAVGLGYTPLCTKELLEAYAKQSMESWVNEEGSDAVAEAERAILESLSSQARAVIATLGGKKGAAGRVNQWRHLFAGFTVWLSLSQATDEESAKEEAKRNMQDSGQGYSNAEVVVKLGGWDPNYSKAVAQAVLSALKRLILADKDLPGKKSLYVRLGCRGDWPDIKPPGWDPSTSIDASSPRS